MMEKNKIIWFLIIVFLLVFSFELGYERGSGQGKSGFSIFSDRRGSEELDLSLFWKAWDVLHENYVDSDKLNSEELVYGAIDGMFRATGDPYTSFLNPEERERFEDDIEGSFEGIGAEIGIRDDILTIVAPLKDSPAEVAGLRAGDKILKIDDESTVDMKIDEAVKKIRGPKDTEVKLTIFRSSSEGNETMEIIVVRGLIKLESVTFEMKEDNVAYISINFFGDATVREFGEIIGKLPRNTNGLILDLRNNPGGLLDAAISIGSKMLPKGEVILIQEDQNGNRKNISATGGDILSDVPTVVIINEGSASASEILAGSLRDNRDNVYIVGMTSFGKGSVQEFIKMNQSAAKITIAKWFTPNGDQIEGVGISPDTEIDLVWEDFENDRDPQLDKAMELLKSI